MSEKAIAITLDKTEKLKCTIWKQLSTCSFLQTIRRTARDGVLAVHSYWTPFGHLYGGSDQEILKAAVLFTILQVYWIRNHVDYPSTAKAVQVSSQLSCLHLQMKSTLQQAKSTGNQPPVLKHTPQPVSAPRALLSDLQLHKGLAQSLRHKRSSYILQGYRSARKKTSESVGRQIQGDADAV